MNSNKISLDGFTDYGKGGLAKFNNNKWEIISLANSKFKGFSSDELFRDSKNNMWIYSDILTKIRGDSWTYYSPQNTLLPEHNVTCINEDADGNLWFGAYPNGLIKYDGINWEIFNEDNSDIPSETIWDIDFDKEGNLWFVSDYTLGLVKFDGNHFTVYDTTNSGLPENDVRTIESDSEGNLWIGTADKGLVKYNNNSLTFYDSQIKWNAIYSLFIDDEDCVWIGGYGLTKFKDGTWSYYEHSDSIGYYLNLITHIRKDINGNIWAIARYGLYKFDGTDWQEFNHTSAGLPDEFLDGIEFDEYGNLWIGTSSGVILFNETGVVSVEENQLRDIIPSKFFLYQNYPNPFNPSTTIKYSIPSSSVIARSEATWQSQEITSSSQQGGIPRNDEVNVTLKVYDILGREITTLINKKQNPGDYEVSWPVVVGASNQPSGVYFYQLKAGNYVETKKMILLR